MTPLKRGLIAAAAAALVVLAVAGCQTNVGAPGPTQSSQLEILTTQMPPAIVGSSYTQAMQGAFNTGAETWTFTGLPSWLSVTLGNEITGTPKVAGTYNFTVTVTDAAGNKATANESIVAS